jgi:sporulation protein YlmC with PRC-barrel domain
MGNQFENSRVSEGTLRSERPVPRDSATDAEISNMIAEGGPASATSGMSDAPRSLASASTLIGHRVVTAAGEELGNIEEIMLDLRNGRMAYAVLSFSGLPGIANKRFPVPWNALRIDQSEFVLEMDRRTFEGAPDFDSNNWPDMADPAFGRAVHKHYGQRPYWEHAIADAGIPPHGLQENSVQHAETRH